jgi:hypothetical protein
VDAFEHAQAVQAAAAAQAAAASEAAAAATLAAADAKTQADAAVAAQRQTVARLEQALADSQTKASALRSELAETRASFQMALGMSASTYRPGGNRVVGPVGSCTGDHVEIYPNGQIPLSALCALASAPGQYLRADAAYAFDRLSRAYAARFGRPLCVTDSYRALATQVQLYATKPTLAAVPGPATTAGAPPRISAAASSPSTPPSTTGCWSTRRCTAGSTRCGHSATGPSRSLALGVRRLRAPPSGRPPIHPGATVEASCWCLERWLGGAW